MIDTGRRFYPVPLVKSILDGMAAVKMNVLHFHLSEECFRVASTSYPALTASCRSGSMTNNEVYSQDDVTELVGYARSRGIRVVPEFDMPGHSGGFCTNLASAGIQCCGSQIEDDPEGKSAEIIQTVGSSTSLHPARSLFYPHGASLCSKVSTALIHVLYLSLCPVCLLYPIAASLFSLERLPLDPGCTARPSECARNVLRHCRAGADSDRDGGAVSGRGDEHWVR